MNQSRVRRYPMIAKKRIAAAALCKTGLRALLAWLDRWSGLLCLNYHRIGDRPDELFDRELWSATPADFDTQVRFLKANFDVVTPADLEDIQKKRTGRHVLITFDDGYRDNFELAFPILRAHGQPASFFLSTGFLDSPRLAAWDEIAWMVRNSPNDGLPAGDWLPEPIAFAGPDREPAIRLLISRYKQLAAEAIDPYLDYLAEATGSGRYPFADAGSPWMTWTMARTLRAAGMHVGGHTVNHPVLSRLPRARQQHEIRGCAERLQAELGDPMTLFSYPFGCASTFNDETRDCLAGQGVRLAFSFYGGFRDFRRADPWDRYDVPRLSVEKNAGFDVFRAKTTLPRFFR